MNASVQERRSRVKARVSGAHKKARTLDSNDKHRNRGEEEAYLVVGHP